MTWSFPRARYREDMTTIGPEPPRLPPNLPVPVDDGAADHLAGRSIPHLGLQSTDGEEVDVAELAEEALVLYVIPKIGRPKEADPPGWDQTPGARGCTQQSCAFRDRHQQFLSLGYSVAGLSAQPAEQQAEAATRLHLAFPLLADPAGRFGHVLDLPTFDVAGMTLYKRLTLVARAERIVKVFYPVFPPDENAEEVLTWIRSNREQTAID
jgi:peroxiredoxin